MQRVIFWLRDKHDKLEDIFRPFYNQYLHKYYAPFSFKIFKICIPIRVQRDLLIKKLPISVKKRVVCFYWWWWDKTRPLVVPTWKLDKWIF